MLKFFTRNRTPTASDIGKLGAAVKHERERETFKATHDDLRERLGLEPWRWAK